MKFRSIALLALCLMAASFLLAACGEDSPPTPTPTAAPTPTPAPALPTLPPTESILPAESTPTAAPVAASPLTVTSSQSQSATAPLTGTTPPPIACAIEPNTDFVGYGDIVGRLGCPLAEGSYGAVAINEFGEGPDYSRFMLWFDDENQIYVLQPQRTWLAYTDTWEEGQPEISCNPENVDEPESPPLPRRGFGKLWCTVEGVRESMGTIEREERLCQHSVVQRFERGRLLACFEDATIRYFRILDDGAWDMEMVQ
jgi:hypothetical protein